MATEDSELVTLPVAQTGDLADGDTSDARGALGAPQESTEHRSTAPANMDDDGGRPEAYIAVIQCPLCDGSFSAANVENAWEPKQGSQYRTCDECDGMGKIRTGSYVSQHSVVDCPVCTANGYVTADNSAPTLMRSDIQHAPPGQQPPWPGAQFNTETGQWF